VAPLNVPRGHPKFQEVDVRRSLIITPSAYPSQPDEHLRRAREADKQKEQSDK
jgi:hypothetical protein